MKKSKKIYIEIPLPATNEEWKANRLLGIGGSDTAAALGMSPWKSPYYLWCEKTQRINNDEDNEAMRLGRDLEEYVAQRFSETTGKKVRKSNYSYQSKEYPFMLANVDRFVIGEDAGLECKTASALTRTRYDKGDIPIQYYLQCMHYMAVTGKQKWYIAVLVMGKGFYWFEVNRDEDEIKIIQERESDFWNYVVNDSMPPIDGSESTTEALREMYPEVEENFTKELEQEEEIFKRYEELKTLKKKIDKEIKEIENNLKVELGGCVVGYTPKYKVQWKNTTTTRVDPEELRKRFPEVYVECLKESKTRRFSIKENTEE